ncbi:hypothetical protein OG369_09930 [Streptomyces sp. NBC_01221]|nr:hypothetical protein [Streptomyces sp. NBC_01221]MCX4786490.1 hypothetical protein [Streptomyces sp. NBC_01221]
MFRSSDLCPADRETVRILKRATAAAKDAEQARTLRKKLEAARTR